MLAFAVIKLTGSLTQKVLGTIKNVLLVIFQVLFMGESVTFQQWLGYQVSLLGFAWYQQQKISAANKVEASKVAAAPGSPRIVAPRTPQQPRRHKV